jgi:hypothetical protein
MWREPGVYKEPSVEHTHARRHVCQADFFASGANWTIFPRSSGEIHFSFLRNLFGI